jgi:hypothetical protein
MYYEVAIGTTRPKCSLYKTQTVAVFQEAGSSDPNATRIRSEFFKELYNAMVAANIP